jgi:DNA polymerase-4
MRKNRFIVHVDMDAFFASVEQRDNPQYRGNPVIVGSDPKSGLGRGVVSTCSYEARKFGIHSAMPISEAYRKCPQAIFLPVDYQKYVQVSGQIIDIFKDFSPAVEQVSIDEAFLDISDTYKMHRSAYETCVAIKNRIKKEIGLTASVGLAPTKMAAKIASGLEKPNGLVEVKKENLLDFLWPLDVDKLWGVGNKTKALLNQMGIRTVGDLTKTGKAGLVSAFGKNGGWFWEMAWGIDESEVESEREAKSISNERTFEKDTCNKCLIMSGLVSLCEQVSDRLREGIFKCRTITLKIRLEGFQTYTRSQTIHEPTNFSEVLIKTIRKLFEDFGVNNRKVRLIGVKASNLSGADEKYLFVDKEEIKKEKVHKAVDKIRHKFGSDSIHRASAQDAIGQR